MKSKRGFILRMILSLSLALTIVIANTPLTVAAQEISVEINGVRVQFADQSPVIVDGRTLIPIRGVFEQLGFNVTWETHSPQTATITNSDYTVHVTIDSAVFTVNGIPRALDVPAQLIGGRTLLPIRAVLEAVGFYVDWNGATQTVLVSDAPFANANNVNVPTGLEIPAYITIRGERFSTNTEFITLNNVTNADISPLRYMVNLRGLNLFGNQISDITPLANLRNLEQLSLGRNQVSDISPLTGLTNLVNLNLYSNPIRDITPLAGLTNLTTLDLENTQISDITILAGLTNLGSLILDDNQIQNLDPLAGLTRLTHLTLSNNQISDISALARLTNLENLFLGGNRIADITPLTNLRGLRNLRLNNNQISDITPLSNITTLWDLNLAENPITDWSPISHIQTYVPGRPHNAR